MSFDRALQHVLTWEGGLVDHPADPGGRTNHGITQITLRDARQAWPALNLPTDVGLLTHAQVAEIYRRMYWNACRCDELPDALALVVFDAAVNAGVAKARQWLQRALKVKVDGDIGPKTLTAARLADARKAVSEVNALRAFHYMLLDDIDQDFGLGWARRLFATHNAALEIA